MGSKLVKRLVDLVGASAGVIVLAPVIAATAAAVRVKLGSPVLFKQVRPGLNKELFTVYKFRSMLDGPGDDGPRLTEFGKFLRATSLDELPQLWNVLRGDMSLVGPRPLLVDYLPLYSKRHIRRLSVKPGLTSWNAVNGRNAMTYEAQFEMDLWYIDHQSFWLDAKIILMTAAKVITREGVTQEGRATRDRYTGSKVHEA